MKSFYSNTKVQYIETTAEIQSLKGKSPGSPF